MSFFIPAVEMNTDDCGAIDVGTAGKMAAQTASA